MNYDLVSSLTLSITKSTYITKSYTVVLVLRMDYIDLAKVSLSNDGKEDGLHLPLAQSSSIYLKCGIYTAFSKAVNRAATVCQPSSHNLDFLHTVPLTEQWCNLSVLTTLYFATPHELLR